MIRQIGQCSCIAREDATVRGDDSGISNDERWMEPDRAYQEMKQFRLKAFPGIRS